jgi:hypothetical protein
MQIRIINVTRTAIREMHKVEEMKTRNDMFISKHVLQHVPNKLRGQQVEIANHFINPGMKWEDVRSIIEDTINTEAYDGLLVIYEDDVISMKNYLHKLYWIVEENMRFAQHFNLVYKDSVLHPW